MRTNDSLKAAIETQDIKGVQSALALGASPNPPSWARFLRIIGVSLEAPLVSAVNSGSLSIVLELIKAGADCDQIGKDGFTSLALAAQGQMEEIVAALIEAGADINKIIWKHTTALLLASYTGNLRVVKLLLDNGATPSSVLNRPDISLLRVKGEVLRLMVAAGGVASPEITNLLESNQALGDFEKRSLSVLSVPSVPSPVSTDESGPKEGG